MGGRETLASRASGDLGSCCLSSLLLHSYDHGPRVGPRGEACLLPAVQELQDPDSGGSHISSPDIRPTHSTHSPPFPNGPCFSFNKDRILGFQGERKSWYPALRISEFGVGKLVGVADSQAQTPDK